ncbi:MAG: hypothetical protein R3B09_19340 [Nannocystaceae bacterium]
MSLRDLKTTPEPVAQAAAALERLDEAFVTGFGRLSSANLEALAGLQRSFAATPLAAEFAAAIQGIGRSEFLDRHFLVLAAARASVHGAIHDALVAQASAALDRPPPAVEAIEARPAQSPPPQAAVWLESTRQWLMELALAGFSNLEVDIILPFQATLDAMESEPSMARHAALLGGLMGELLAVFPNKGAPEIPRLRWVDLWSRAMIMAAAPPEALATRSVSGELKILGTDLRQHDMAATLVVFAALDEAGSKATRICRIYLTAFKVDVIQGDELGALFTEIGANLLAALAGGQRLTIKDMPLAGNGDLRWDDAKAKPGAKASVIEDAAAALGKAPAARPVLFPADRHPALIEELVWVPPSEYAKDFPLEIDRMAETDELVGTDLAGSKGFVALLRHDGGAWFLQPIVVSKGKPQPRMVGQALAAGAKKTGRGSSLAILKERASKLLRKKS